MKTIKLKNIELTDWKGQSNTLCFDGKTSIILGQNGIGKSSIYMSFCWLLTGYTDALNPSNHELFDSRKKMSESTPAAVVTAIIDVDGEEITLYRSAKPQYASNKLDGTYTKLSSDKYTFRVNDVEMSAKEYNDYIDNMLESSGIDEKTFEDTYGVTIDDYCEREGLRPALLYNKVMEKVFEYGKAK